MSDRPLHPLLQPGEGVTEALERLQGLFDKWHTIAAEKEAEINQLRHDIEQYVAASADLATENERLRAACERMMIGGNHLATYRTEFWPSPGSDPAIALDNFGAGEEYDMWCCWNAIMCARNSLEPPTH